MTKTDYVVLWMADDEGSWGIAAVVEQARDSQAAIEEAVLAVDAETGKSAGDYVAVPKRYWNPVPRHVETVKTVVGGPNPS